MKPKLLTALISIGLFVSCSNEKTAKDTDKEKTKPEKEEAWIPVDSATMMKAMMDYGTPGPMHQMLASWNGTWTVEMTHWGYEGATPQTASGTAVNSMLFDGRYQQSTHTSDMMGMKFEGRSIMGYDNATKQFVSTWFDNWSTGIMTMTGTWDEATKTMTLSGTMPDIVRPGKECHLKEKFTIVDDNTQHMEMWGPDPKTGKEYKMMEIKMSRKK